MAVISRLKKETFVTGSKSEVIKSHVVQHCSVSIPEGAIRPGTVINMQVKPVDENFNDQQEGAAISPILKLSPSDVVISRPLTISFPTPTYTLRREYEEAPEQHLLMQPAGKPGYEWQDVTLSTPLKIMNGYATFTTEEMGKYCLIDSYNETNVVNDTRLMCKKLNRVPYMAKFVVFAKISSNTTMAKFRVFCMTDDKVDKTLETQTGFTEVACSRNIEINNGQTIFFNCQGNVEVDADCNLQMNFFAFRENRLPFIARVIDSNQQMKMKLLVILNPIRDQQGKIHVASALDIDLSTDTIGRDTELQKISDNLLQLIAKQLNEDWNSFGEKIGLNDGKLQDILDLNGHNYEASAFEVVQIWRDEQGPDASLEKLESVLQAIGREDILKNFKHLTNSSYGTHDRLLVTEIHRNGDTKHTNGHVEGNNDILIDSSCEKSVEEKRYSSFLKDSTSNADREGNDDEKSKNIIEGMFSNDEEILRFFQDNVTNNTETEID